MHRCNYIRPWTVLAAWLACAMFAPASAWRTENVVIVVVDGARCYEFLEHPTHAYIPHIWNELRPQGYVSHGLYNTGQTKTIPGHASLVTGTDQRLSNDGTERPTRPTLWEYMRSQTGAGSDAAVLVTYKDKLAVISYSTYPGYGAADSATVVGPLWDDARCVSEFFHYAEAYHPRLGVIALGGTDITGHNCVWTPYVNAIANADSLVATVWNWIQAEPIYSDRTALFVVGDHGRHDANWCAHGDSCAGCVRVPLVALGPDFFAGLETGGPPADIRDVGVTAGELLDIAMPLAEGRILWEMIAGPTPAPDASLASPPLLSISTPALDGARVRLLLDGLPAVQGRWRLVLYDVTGRRLISEEHSTAELIAGCVLSRPACATASGLTWLTLTAPAGSQVGDAKRAVLWLR